MLLCQAQDVKPAVPESDHLQSAPLAVTFPDHDFA